MVGCSIFSCLEFLIEKRTKKRHEMRLKVVAGRSVMDDGMNEGFSAPSLFLDKNKILILRWCSFFNRKSRPSLWLCTMRPYAE
jgi:hypothetical protein